MQTFLRIVNLNIIDHKALEDKTFFREKLVKFRVRNRLTKKNQEQKKTLLYR
ncbi:hypothetical protein SAMN05444395_10263 [Flavobacterium fryxellicola]|nr:hypothetical protein SAMN05444395_10263 [Flavobacterium fryxellicola]